MELLERAAQASGGYTDEEWSSDDPLDELTRVNARAVARNILAMPEIAEALALKTEIDGLKLGPSV